MKVRAHNGTVLGMAALALIAMAAPAMVGAAEGGDGRQTYTLKGVVNASGRIVDQSGKELARVEMSQPGVAFDVATMHVDRDGRVKDQTGATVGRVVFADGPGSAGVGVPAPATFRIDAAGNAIDGPGNIVGYVAGIKKPGIDFSGATLNSRGNVVAANGRTLGRLVMDGAGAADLARRRSKLSERIDSEAASQNITAEQSARLRQDLAATAQAEARFKRDGTINDQETGRLYVGWDRIAERLDRFLAANARMSIGLRTK